MQYSIEDLSPVKKKISVTVPAPEAGAAIDEAATTYRGAVKLNGFRKGKAPAGIIEKRFGKEIVQQATDKLVEENLKEILSGKTFEAVSRLVFDGSLVERGKDFVYSLVFEVMPEFDFPDYEGVELEQVEAAVDEAAIEAVLLNMRRQLAETAPLKEERKAQDGDVAVIDFAALGEDGAVLAGFASENFKLALGEGRSFPDFEELIKGLELEEEKESPLTFPAEFINADLAGRTVNMRIKLKGLKEKILPAMDDDFARKAGNFASFAELRENLCTTYLRSREEANKEAAQKVFLDKLLEKTDFPVPNIMLENQVNALVREFQDNMQRHGQNVDILQGGGWDSLRAQMRPEAERRARAQVLLLTLAKKLEFEIGEQDIDTYLRGLARQSGQELKVVREYYIRNNLLPGLANMLLADKAMAELYAKARVVMVQPAAPVSEDKEAGKDETQGATVDDGDRSGVEDAGD